MCVLQPVVYMGIHVVLCWFATLTAMIWWHSKTAHTLFLIFCASVSAWNGKPPSSLHTSCCLRLRLPASCLLPHSVSHSITPYLASCSAAGAPSVVAMMSGLQA